MKQHYKKHLDRMTCVQCVEPHRGRVLELEDLIPDVELWKKLVQTGVLDPRGEALVEPQVRPPLLLEYGA